MSKFAKFVIGTVAVGFVYASGWWKGVNDTLNYVKDKGLLDNDIDTGDGEKAWKNTWKSSPIYNSSGWYEELAKRTALNVDDEQKPVIDNEEDKAPEPKAKPHPCSKSCCDGCNEMDPCCIEDPKHKVCIDGDECPSCPVLAMKDEEPVEDEPEDIDIERYPFMHLVESFLDGLYKGIHEAMNEDGDERK